MTKSKKSPGAIRQENLRKRRTAGGQYRKEYWATTGEHKSLSKHLKEIRKDDK